MASKQTLKKKLSNRITTIIDPRRGFVGRIGDREGNVFYDYSKSLIFVRDPNRNIHVVANRKFPSNYDMKVVVGYESRKSNLLEVVKVVDAYSEQRYPEVPTHSKSHEWPNLDTMFVRKEQVLYMTAIPTADNSFVVQLYGGEIVINGIPNIFSHTTFDATSYVPSSGAKWILLQIKPDLTIDVQLSDEYTSYEQLTPSRIPAFTYGYYPYCAIKVYYGQLGIVHNLKQRDIYNFLFTNFAIESPTYWNDILDKPNIEVLVQGAYRWIADGIETEFILTDYLEELEQVFDNSLLVDPFVVNLSSDSGSVVFDNAPTDGHIIMAYGILRSL